MHLQHLALGAVLALIAVPAHATGGFLCKTAGPEKIEIAIGIGHVPGGPLIYSHLKYEEREIETQADQWWFDGSQMRILLTDPSSLDRIAVMQTELNERSKWGTFDGSVTMRGKRHWIRCYEN